MNGWDMIIGHQWATAMLADSVRRNLVGHAYLFTGPAQIGKTVVARTFAKALNCLEPVVDERPCGRCRSCRLIDADRHPDVISLRGESSGRGRRTLKIDQIRDLQVGLNLSPAEARFKVAILKEFDDANPNAANAFLKTLEEPPARVILLLTAAVADVLLPTVVSRCRQVNLRLVPAELIREALTGRQKAELDLSRLLARLSQGRVGWAIRAASDPAILARREQRLNRLMELLAQSIADRFITADALARDGEELPEVLDIWLSWWRDVALLTYGDGSRDGIANLDWLETLNRQSSNWSPAQVRRALRDTESSLQYLKQNANGRLVVENLLLSYPRL